jgi:hypothetical protein
VKKAKKTRHGCVTSDERQFVDSRFCGLLLSQRQLVMPISIFVADHKVCFKLAAQQKPADEIGKWTFFFAISLRHQK